MQTPLEYYLEKNLEFHEMPLGPQIWRSELLSNIAAEMCAQKGFEPGATQDELEAYFKANGQYHDVFDTENFYTAVRRVAQNDKVMLIYDRLLAADFQCSTRNDMALRKALRSAPQFGKSVEVVRLLTPGSNFPWELEGGFEVKQPQLYGPKADDRLPIYEPKTTAKSIMTALKQLESYNPYLAREFSSDSEEA